tara:strand:- start:735 stop:2042 length:1308 start_codon:yes stop_codon:yes gene_type:complete
MNPMYYILLAVTAFVVAIDFYKKKKNQKSESKDIDKFNDNVFTEEPKKINYLSIAASIFILTLAFFLTDKYVYDGRLSDNNDNISFIQNFTLDKVSINDISSDDSLWVYKSDLSLLTAKVVDSLGNFNGIVINGMQEGFWRYFYNNEQINAELNFVNSKANGDIGNTGIPKNGRIGKANFWHENGQQQEIKTYSASNRLDGEFKSWYENGQLERTRYYNDGIIVGENKKWHENGQLAFIINYKDDKLHGKYYTWYENGQQEQKSNYKDNKLDGSYQKWFENGQLNIQTSHKKGETDGVFTRWFSNGAKKFEGLYEMGKQEGLHTLWFINGNISTTENFLNDLLNGTKKEYDQDGTIKYAYEYYYDYSLKASNKSSTSFYTNGVLTQITEYRNGVYYWKDEAVESISWYDVQTGRKTQFQSYDKNGNPKGKRKYYN